MNFFVTEARCTANNPATFVQLHVQIVASGPVTVIPYYLDSPNLSAHLHRILIYLLFPTRNHIRIPSDETHDHQMTSLVSEFIINPVLRTARRFSRNGVDEIVPPAPNERVLGDNKHEAAVEDIAEQLDGEDEPATEERPGEGGISGGPFTSSPIESGHGLEAELDALGIGRPPDPTVNNGHSIPVGLGSFRPSPNDVDDDVSNNPSFGIPRGLRTSSGTSTSNTIVDARMSPAEGPSRNSTIDAAAAHHRNNSLPADDGMGPLRQQIIIIQAMDVPAEEKARLMHMLLTRGYAKAQRSHTKEKQPATLPGRMVSQERPTTPESLASFIWQMNGAVDPPAPSEQHTFHLSPSDLARTYAPIDPPEVDEDGEVAVVEETPPMLGCKHYKRNVKLQCSACERWYTCRLCHDEVEDHVLNRKATKNMLCMLCGCAQRAGEFCVECGDRTAWYYCGVCKLWDNDSNKSIYHCNDCGICRKGRGLGKDFFHCKASISYKDHEQKL